MTIQICTPSDVFDEKSFAEKPAKVREALEEYLKHFHKPDINKEKGTVMCNSCGMLLYSTDIMSALFSTFQWGIVHGEGFCNNCGWHYRMYHSLPQKGENDKTIGFTHPLAHRCDDKDGKEVDPAEQYAAQKAKEGLDG